MASTFSVTEKDGSSSSDSTDKYLSFAQGKDIATRALKKGFAVQKLYSRIYQNSVDLRHKRILIARLKANLYGKSDDLDIDGTGIVTTAPPCLSDVQFKLLRQEQLSLMAENTRLVRLLESRSTNNYTSNDSGMAISHAIRGNVWGCDSLVIKDRSYALEKIVLMLDKVVLKILAKAFRQIFLYAFLQDNIQNVKSKIKNNAIRIRMFYACSTLIQSIRNVYRRDLSSFLNSLIRESFAAYSQSTINPLEFMSEVNKKATPIVPFPTYYKNLHSVKNSQ